MKNVNDVKNLERHFSKIGYESLKNRMVESICYLNIENQVLNHDADSPTKLGKLGNRVTGKTSKKKNFHDAQFALLITEKDWDSLNDDDLI